MLVILITLGIISSEPTEEYDLSELRGLDRTTVLQKLGTPNKSELVYDDETSYYYMYSTGLSVMGKEDGITELILATGDIEEKGNVIYTVQGIALDSSFDKAVKTLGTPNWSGSSEGRQSVMYHDPKEDMILNLLSDVDSEKIVGIRYVKYDSSAESDAMKLLNLIGVSFNEEQIKRDLNVNNSIPNPDETTHYFASSTMENWVKRKQSNDQVFELELSSTKFFNVGGLRIGDSYSKAEELFGKPIKTEDGYEDVKLVTFDLESKGGYQLEISTSNGKIGFISVKQREQPMAMEDRDENTTSEEVLPEDGTSELMEYVNETTLISIQFPSAWGEPVTDNLGNTTLYKDKIGQVDVNAVLFDGTHGNTLADYLLREGFDEQWYLENDPDGSLHEFSKLELTSGYDGYAYTMSNGDMRHFNHVVFNEEKAIRLNLINYSIPMISSRVCMINSGRC